MVADDDDDTSGPWSAETTGPWPGDEDDTTGPWSADDDTTGPWPADTSSSEPTARSRRLLKAADPPRVEGRRAKGGYTKKGAITTIAHWPEKSRLKEISAASMFSFSPHFIFPELQFIKE